MNTRLALVTALGMGIDNRGGHAAGYVSLDKPEAGKAVRLAKRIGTWEDGSARFSYGAARGQVVMMHSRYATCGKRDSVDHAHPFVIRREDKAVLYGAHNGVLQGTWTSASRNKREHTVDSREMLELLADNDLSAIQNLDGYGVVTWITPASGAVNLVRLSKQSDMIVVSLKGGGTAWASTWDILRLALDCAKLEAEYTLDTSKVGTVYQILPTGIVETERTGVHVDNRTLSERYPNTYGYRGNSITSTYPRVYADYDDGDGWLHGFRRTYTSEDREREEADGNIMRDWVRDTSFKGTFTEYQIHRLSVLAKKKAKDDAEAEWRASEARRRANAAHATTNSQAFLPQRLNGKDEADAADDTAAYEAELRRLGGKPAQSDTPPDTERVPADPISGTRISDTMPSAGNVFTSDVDNALAGMTEADLGGKSPRFRWHDVDNALAGMTEADLDELTDEQWDSIIQRYRVAK